MTLHDPPCACDPPSSLIVLEVTLLYSEPIRLLGFRISNEDYAGFCNASSYAHVHAV